MKEITDALGLPETADVPAIVAAITKLKQPAPAPELSDAAKLDKRIRAKMKQAPGALSYDQARIAVEQQDLEDARKKKGARK
jgi:hypothetical protein